MDGISNPYSLKNAVSPLQLDPTKKITNEGLTSITSTKQHRRKRPIRKKKLIPSDIPSSPLELDSNSSQWKVLITKSRKFEGNLWIRGEGIVLIQKIDSSSPLNRIQ